MIGISKKSYKAFSGICFPLPLFTGRLPLFTGRVPLFTGYYNGRFLSKQIDGIKLATN